MRACASPSTYIRKKKCVRATHNVVTVTMVLFFFISTIIIVIIWSETINIVEV